MAPAAAASGQRRGPRRGCVAVLMATLAAAIACLSPGARAAEPDGPRAAYAVSPAALPASASSQGVIRRVGLPALAIGAELVYTLDMDMGNDNSVAVSARTVLIRRTTTAAGSSCRSSSADP
jgi:hypothetical protein